MEFAVPMRRRTGERGRERAFGEKERTAGVFASGLYEDLRRPGIMVLALSWTVKHRIHGANSTPRILRSPRASGLDVFGPTRAQAPYASGPLVRSRSSVPRS